MHSLEESRLAAEMKHLACTCTICTLYRREETCSNAHSLEESRLAAEMKHLACTSAHVRFAHFIEERRLAVIQDGILQMNVHS